jgi:pimeloyl-ACP methyl ester carboxylesterase
MTKPAGAYLDRAETRTRMDDEKGGHCAQNLCQDCTHCNCNDRSRVALSPWRRRAECRCTDPPNGQYRARPRAALCGTGHRNAPDFRPRFAERRRVLGGPDRPICQALSGDCVQSAYNYPNVNPVRRGYSAVVDAEDLAAFIHTLHLGKVVVIGHSYGALTALFLAAKHPELVRALVLAEPPAISLLMHLPSDEAKTGKAMFEDIQRKMVAPMQQAFRKGDHDAGIAAFMDYVFNDPHAWDKMPESAREDTLRDAHEWDVMMTTGILFPNIEPPTIRRITAPVLLLSGAKSYQFLGLITEELARLLPNRETIVLPDAGHQMWYQAPDVCRRDVETFLVHIGIPSLHS